MDLLSHPFRLAPDGSASTVEDDTTEATLEAIAVLALTRKGERDLAPLYGMADPTFTDVDVAELNLALTDYVSDTVAVTAITATPVDPATTRVVIETQEP